MSTKDSPPDKLTVPLPVTEFPHILQNPKSHYPVHNLLFVPDLSHMNPVHTPILFP